MITSGHRERDDEQQHRHRRGVAHVEEPEPVVVEEDRVEERRALGVAELERARAACLRRLPCRDARGDVRLREVLQALDHAEHDGEEDHGADQRERHPAEALPRPGAVELGRLVEVPRDVEHGGEEDDHRVPDPPEAQHHERGLRPARVVEPERPLDPELAEDRVDRPGGGVQEVDEPERRGDGRDERREVEDRPEDPDPAPSRA